MFKNFLGNGNAFEAWVYSKNKHKDFRENFFDFICIGFNKFKSGTDDFVKTENGYIFPEDGDVFMKKDGKCWCFDKDFFNLIFKEF